MARSLLLLLCIVLLHACSFGYRTHPRWLVNPIRLLRPIKNTLQQGNSTNFDVVRNQQTSLQSKYENDRALPFNLSLSAIREAFHNLDEQRTHYNNVLQETASNSQETLITTATQPVKKVGFLASLFRPLFLSRLLSWILTKIVKNNTDENKGLDIIAHSHNSHRIVQGKIDTVDMKFDKISFAQLLVSGGGRIILQNVDLKMRRLFFQNNVQSIQRPYMMYTDLQFTAQDIINSKLIRNLIQMLVDTILDKVVITNKLVHAKIRKVALKSRRLCAMGTARLLMNNNVKSSSSFANIDFEVSTSAGMRDQGQTLFLKDIQVVLNPESILRTVMPILTTAPIDIDLGEDCRIEHLVISNRHVHIRGASIITPVSPFSVCEVKSQALYRYDLSAFLSSLLRLNGGLAMRLTGRRS